ncbi:thioesterase-like superfamily-domain-containing protein [Trichophaea hybrida]|nr:thioesterase-like superfamily-domain-containing protein [Trichophaea hybrida]
MSFQLFGRRAVLDPSPLLNSRNIIFPKSYYHRPIITSPIILLAAQLTVPEKFTVHSMHCYFVLNGNPRIPIIYYVDIVREGRSFHTRTVQAKQRGNAIFTTTCSFTIPISAKFPDDENRMRSVVIHEPVFAADTVPPEQCESEGAIIDRLLRTGRIDEDGAAMARARCVQDQFEWRSVGLSRLEPETANTAVEPERKIWRKWVRSKAPIANPLFNNPALAYISDSWFLGTVGRVNPAARRERMGMMVSLDHTIYFHAGEKTRLDDWLLVETTSPWAGEERGLVRMNIWTKDGMLLATCVQEGILRLKDGREGNEVQDGASSGTVSPKPKL